MCTACRAWKNFSKKSMIVLRACAHNSAKEANQVKKWILALLCMIAAGMTLSGCSSGTANTMNPTTVPMTAQPTATMTQSPQPTASPTAMMTEAPVNMTPAEAGQMAERISEAVERISEIDDAEVVVYDDRVLVAVEFDDQYSAGLDDRMKQMITEKVQEVEQTLTRIEITDDDTLYGQVKNFAERVGQATGLDELADDFGDLWNRITGM